MVRVSLMWTRRSFSRSLMVSHVAGVINIAPAKQAWAMPGGKSSATGCRADMKNMPNAYCGEGFSSENPTRGIVNESILKQVKRATPTFASAA